MHKVISVKWNFRSKKPSVSLYKKKKNFKDPFRTTWNHQMKKKRILFHPSSFKPKLKTSSNTHNRQKGLIEFVKFQFNVSIASKQIELDHRFISDFFMHLLSIHRTIYSISSITWIKRNSRAILSSLSLSFFPINHILFNHVL